MLPPHVFTVTLAAHARRGGLLLAMHVGMAPTRPLNLNKSNGSELQNADILIFFRRSTCSTGAFIHYNTLKVRKIHSYSHSDLKRPIVRHLSSVRTTYHETGVNNCSNSFTKIIWSLLSVVNYTEYMILDVQNLHTFFQSRQTRVLQPYKCSFRRHFLLFLRTEHAKF